MECLHSHCIIHRDLKVLMLPHFEIENLLVSADQKTIKLADFRFAREETLIEIMTGQQKQEHIVGWHQSCIVLSRCDKGRRNAATTKAMRTVLPLFYGSSYTTSYHLKNVRPNADNLPEEMYTVLISC